MTTTSLKAKDYVKALDLSGTPRGLVAQGPATEASEVFENAKKQAQIVGSGLLAFQEGVPAEVRESISDSALLAQLVANKRVDPAVDPLGWFKQYATVLENVGWVMQDGGWNDYATQGTAAEVHEKLIELLPVLLGPAPAALAVATAALTALHGMKPDSSWITIFSRESQKAKLARFQIGIVENAAGGPQVSLMAFLIEAKSSITQVLFFKFRNDDASFKANTTKVSINAASLKDLAIAIRGKVRAYQVDYLSSIKDI